MWRTIVNFLADHDSSPELLKAQYAVMSRQTPLMYMIVVVNMIVLSTIHHGMAPNYLTIYLPALICSVCIYRAWHMVRERHHAYTAEQLKKKFRLITGLAVVLGGGIVLWSIGLFQYGEAHTQGHVTFFIGLTIIAVMTCLMPLRQVPVILFAIVVIPATLFLFQQDQIVFKAISINMFLVVLTMIFVLFRSHNDFRTSIEKQSELTAQRRELQSLNNKVSKLADEDVLTGLPNRRSFFARLDYLISLRSGMQPFAVGLIDLDGFKPVNDVHGHGAGDKLLRAVSERLKSKVPEFGMVARLGGDEFGIILDRDLTDEEVLAICKDLLAVLEPAFQLVDGSASISATCGIARYPDAGRTGNELYECADFALYYSKENHRGSVTIFSREHEIAIKKVATISQRLRDADLELDFSMQFQPIVDGHDGRILGFEALARWSDTILGQVAPDVFIRSAEQNGMISRITLALLKKALDSATNWPQQTYLSFNLSAQDLCSPDTITEILDLVATSDVQPGRLVFEITESAVMQDFDRAIISLQRLKKAGASLALDDFGTGYSSLSYLRRLPIDRIKVDRSFIIDLETDQAARDIINTITGLSRNLRLKCIVEGVETHGQLNILTAAGCNAYQGFLFGRAMDGEDVASCLAGQGPVALAS